MQKNNGITLVVLIIIVVVMLILLSVTVNIAIDGNLFGKAEEAVNKTNKKVGTLQNDVDYYTNLIKLAELVIVQNLKTYVQIYCLIGLVCFKQQKEH